MAFNVPDQPPAIVEEATFCVSQDDENNILLKKLKEWHIAYKNYCHKPLFTVEEAKSTHEQIPGAHTKTLFLRSKKDKFILVAMLDDQRLNLKEFNIEEIGKGFSMAKEEELLSILHLKPGHVTPFALMHPAAKNVTVVLDEELLDRGEVNFHPLQNNMTTTVESAGLIQFIKNCGFIPIIRKLPKI